MDMDMDMDMEMWHIFAIFMRRLSELTTEARIWMLCNDTSRNSRGMASSIEI